MKDHVTPQKAGVRLDSARVLPDPICSESRGSPGWSRIMALRRDSFLRLMAELPSYTLIRRALLMVHASTANAQRLTRAHGLSA